MPLNADQEGIFRKWVFGLLAQPQVRPESEEAGTLVALMTESASSRLDRLKAWAAQEVAGSAKKIADIKARADREEMEERARKGILDSIAEVTKL